MTDLQIKQNDALERVHNLNQQIIVLADILQNLTIELSATLDEFDEYHSCHGSIKDKTE